MFIIDDASSLVRTEYKYFISHDIYNSLLDDLRKFTNLDQYSDSRSGHYHVSSIYFDNISLNSYFEKISGLAKRIKPRIRFYPLGAKSRFKVELKYKLYDKCLKKTTNIDRRLLAKMFCDSFDFNSCKDNKILSVFLHFKKVNNYWPFIRVDYQRKAMVDKEDSRVRITIDKDIKCCRFKNDLLESPYIPAFPRQLKILEIKAKGYYPAWLTNIIKKYCLKRIAISKYVLAVQKVTCNSSMCIK